MGTALVLAQAVAYAAQQVSCVLVTVARVAGSGPREVGARMLVTQRDAFDTIGGGQLEYRAIEIARGMLAAPLAPARSERFALSARVGQCCGGTVWLAMERLDSPLSIAPIREALATVLRGESIQRQLVLQNGDAPELWIDTMCDPSQPVALFGAGHVGRAVAQVLSVADLSLTWIDSRDAQFPSNVSERVRCIESDSPVAELAAIPKHASCLVMTHSHALDFEIIEALLKRQHTGFIGLIGSTTKRMHFEKRLLMRGYAPAQLQRLTCPIGLSSIASKHPGAIAIAIAAQLLQLHTHTIHALTAH